MASEQDDFLFLDHEDDTPESNLPQGYWDILVVDDDPEIHSVTKLALSGVEFWGKALRFHHAYSGEEAIQQLIHNPEICLLLLDVVMESDDAGLKVVKKVRDELDNNNVRIILRTGQPGHAPEEQVIREYDINDYKMKTELTRSKLVTSLMTALRSFQQICELEAQSEGLANILDASNAILGHNNISGFSQSVVMQLANILANDANGFVCAQVSGTSSLVILGGTTQYHEYIGQGVEQLDNGRAIMQVKTCIEQKRHQQTEHDLTLFLEKDNEQAAIFVELALQPLPRQIQFAEIFLANVGVGLDNIKLFSQIREVAYKDPLTKLANRTSFVEQLEKTNRSEALSLILLDIAQFSDINNGLGQEVGNQLLMAVMQRLEQDIPNAKTLARIGADVFAFLLPTVSLHEESLIDELTIPYQLKEHLLSIHFHMGLCKCEDFSDTGLETLKKGYIALNQAKQSHKVFDWYTPDLEEKMAWRLGLIRQLRSDFEQHKLEVWYQPQFSAKNQQIIGCEALLRWPSDNGRYISPAIFVPLAESSGLIVEIGQWVLEQACLQQKRFAQLGLDIGVAVNVSVPQFKTANYATTVMNTLEQYDVPSSKIELEVTESVVMDEISSVIDTLDELKSYGIEVAIDDFGTGFSSLSYLQKLPLSRLKIDRAFIKDIPDSDTGAIAELIVSLGKNLGLKTIAEGVETQVQLERLQQMGCDEIQGFLLGKPMPVDELMAFVQSKLES
ncbi:EAL domain-containing protein [Pseudoalteromonas phenolica]|uniref:bifunctional diguanylate cyclase/phosphodiesterase n=1 Tax=Pseudoalteromonas phenolica TaxID=161398 RepID=UPI00384F2CD3